MLNNFERLTVTNIRTGRKICECGEEKDAIMMVELDPGKRIYTRDRFILDQIIDVTATTDKQLPGQLGLPAVKEKLPPVELQQQVWLPESQAIPFIP